MNKLTNFQMTTHFNSVLGQGVAQTPIVPSLGQCRLRLAMIKEESQTELSKAFDSRDLLQIADAIGDSLVTVYGAANDCGLDADAIMEQVYLSNMSKLCDTEQDAVFAVEQYRLGNGFHGKTTPINAMYRESSIPGKYVVFDGETGKTLKGPSFFEPKLEQVVFPEGRPEDPFAQLRTVAETIGVRGETLWQFQSVLDQIAVAMAASDQAVPMQPKEAEAVEEVEVVE